MTPKKTRLVTEQDDGSGLFEFNCPYPTGCGEDPNNPEARYRAFNYDRDSAVARGKQHIAEHEAGEVMPETHEFRIARGITAAPPTVNPEDWEL